MVADRHSHVGHGCREHRTVPHPEVEPGVEGGVPPPDDLGGHVEHVTHAGRTVPLERSLLEHDLPAQFLELGSQLPKPGVEDIVDVSQVVGVVHDALLVDLAVADPDACVVGHLVSDPGGLVGEVVGEPVPLLRHRHGAGPTRRGPPPDRSSRFQERRSLGAQPLVANDEVGERTTAGERRAHVCSDDGMGLPERHAGGHEVLGEVDGGRVRAVRRLGHPVGVELDRGHHAVERQQRQPDGVAGVEERFLVLLEVLVVGQRQPLEGRQEPREVPEQPTGLAPGQLGHVGVLLLWQHRRAGREGVVEYDEAELVGRPEDDLLAEPREVDAEERQAKEGLGDEVPVGHDIDRVLEPGGEPEVGGDAVRVERQRRPGQRACAQRRHVGPIPGIEQPIHVPRERPAVGQQVVGQQHRLRLLEVRVARQVRLADIVGAGRQRRLQAADETRQFGQLPPDPEPKVGGDLVVATPPRVEPGAGVAGQLGDPPLDRRVDVLVGRDEGERAVTHLQLDGVEGGQHCGRVVRVEQADAGQHPDVRP